MSDIETAIREIEETNGALHLLGQYPMIMWSRSLTPGKWSGIQILAHIADADMVCYTRLHQAIVETGDTLFPVPMDGARWVELLRCETRPVEVSLAAINGARIGIAHTLRVMPESILRRELKHVEMGVVTPLQYAQIAAEHGKHHLAQLEIILSQGDRRL